MTDAELHVLSELIDTACSAAQSLYDTSPEGAERGLLYHVHQRLLEAQVEMKTVQVHREES